MTYLPDVNVWVALTVSGHVHHISAQEWFDGTENDTVSFCRVTQMGFLRLLTNERVMGPDALSPSRAWNLWASIRQSDRVNFSVEPPNLENTWRTAISHRAKGPNFWTDTYLAAFASAAGCTFVTFDKGFRKHKNIKVRVLGAAII